MGQRPLGPKRSIDQILHNAVRGPFTGFFQRQAFLVLAGEDPPALATGMRGAAIRRDGKGGHRLDDGAADAIAMDSPHCRPVARSAHYWGNRRAADHLHPGRDNRPPSTSSGILTKRN